MNRLVIIGNGFDIAHGLKTSYMDFINWYWERRLNAMLTEHAPISEDCLCKLEIKNTTECANWFNFFYSHSFRDLFTREWNSAEMIANNMTSSMIIHPGEKIKLYSSNTISYKLLKNDR